MFFKKIGRNWKNAEENCRRSSSIHWNELKLIFSFNMLKYIKFTSADAERRKIIAKLNLCEAKFIAKNRSMA